MSHELELSVVMPCLNESDTLETCITKAQKSIADAGIAGEIIIADNGSTDGSVDIAKQLGARVVNVPVRGYGAALQAGIEAAEGRFIIMGDADDSYDFSKLLPFVEKLRGGADLVMGCRLPGGGGTVAKGAMPPTHRLIGNPLFTFLARRWFGMPTHDVYCGLRGFTRELYDSLDLRCLGMEFATEMIIKASLFGKRIEEVPITLHPDGRVSHPPHLKTVSDGLRTLRFYLIYCPRWLFAVPGSALLTLGVLSFAVLLPGPFEIAPGVRLDVHTLLVGGISSILGFQLLVFALFTLLFAMSEGLIPSKPRWLELGQNTLPVVGFWLGLALAVSGVGAMAYATLVWSRLGFGNLDYPTMMRLVIPACTVIALGLQAVFSGLFVGILSLKRKR
jgi:glycosyltransferase involved in cell wall biosynthesis